MRTIALPELQHLIEKVKSTLLTSNDIVPRALCPYYHSHPSVPPVLTLFKGLLTQCRAVSDPLVNALGRKQTGSDVTDYTSGQFSHELVANLTSCCFGIGDCGEMVHKLAAELILAGCGDLVFITLRLNKSSPGMEMGHQILIANMPKPSFHSQHEMQLQDFLKTLPATALVADPFLGVCFQPPTLPRTIIDYLKAYGGSAILWRPPVHIFNFSASVLTQHYLIHAGKIAKQMKDKGLLDTEKLYDTQQLTAIHPEENPALVTRLNEMTALKFTAYKTPDIFVHAIAEIESKTQRKHAILLLAECLSTPLGQWVGLARNIKGNQIIYIQYMNEPNYADHIQNIVTSKAALFVPHMRE